MRSCLGNISQHNKVNNGNNLINLEKNILPWELTCKQVCNCYCDILYNIVNIQFSFWVNMSGN